MLGLRLARLLLRLTVGPAAELWPAPLVIVRRSLVEPVKVLSEIGTLAALRSHDPPALPAPPGTLTDALNSSVRLEKFTLRLIEPRLPATLFWLVGEVAAARL